MSGRGTDARGERGETLIELIVAVAILGTSIVVLVGALAAAVANATRQQTDAKGQSVLNAYAEQATRTPFIPCATPDDYTDRLKPLVPAGDYQPGVTRVASWDGAAYRSGSRLLTDIGATTTSFEVQEPAGLPPEPVAPAPFTPYEIRVDAAPGTPPERMTVTNRVGSTLTVTRTAGILHDADEAVSVCPPNPPDPRPGSPSQSRYQAQLLDLAVDGPPVAQLGTSELYNAAMSVAKRGPLQVLELTATAVEPAPAAKAGSEVSLTDEARLSLPPGAIAPTGTLTFSLYGPDAADPTKIDCTDPVATDARNLDGVTPDASGAYEVDGEVSYSPPAAGKHGWVVAYSGDASYEGATGVCGADGQSVAVEKATPTLTATVWRPPGSTAAVGDETTAAARLVGGATPTGEIAFELYGSAGDTTCTGTAVAQTPPNRQAIAPAGDDTPSLPYIFRDEGTYRWRATYAGDANNEAATSDCIPEKGITVTP